MQKDVDVREFLAGRCKDAMQIHRVADVQVATQTNLAASGTRLFLNCTMKRVHARAPGSGQKMSISVGSSKMSSQDGVRNITMQFGQYRGSVEKLADKAIKTSDDLFDLLEFCLTI
jgi:hypothetical protein